MDSRIRLATEADAPAMAALYAPVVRGTAISFELEPPDADEFRRRLREVLRLAPWLVLEREGGILGYAYGTSFRARPAYRFAVETAIYVRSDAHRTGVGRALYGALLPCLERQGFRRAIAGVTLPNAPSVGLHEALGFRPAGRFSRVGWKFGRWHDVGFWERDLGSEGDPPREPLPVAAAWPGP
ncbi:MAG: N-acetyltransferase family protein [Planctomycetes bacterium]|nr:N-acetyltransferase family protein [Planctomycetota bacterium]